jgi:putative transposase
VIDILVDAGFSVKKCCEVLGVSSAGYYLAKTRSDVADDDPSRVAHRAHQRGPRRQSWHLRFSRPRARRADQRPRGSRQPVTILMHNAEIAGVPGPRKVKRIKGTPTSEDLVQRNFEPSSLDELWVSDITEHPTREGKVYCCCVLDTCSRRIVGWSIDSAQDTNLVVNALDMAIK